MLKYLIAVRHKINFNIFFVLLSGLLIRLVLSNFGTLSLDQGTFIAWGTRLLSSGFGRFYEAWSDYQPGYLYVLWALAKVRTLINISPTVLYKIPAVLSDLAIGFVIYKIVKKYKGEKWGLVSSALFVFNPAILSNSTLWGQVDSVTSLFSLLSVWLASSNFILSAIFLAVGTLIKPQAAFVAIVILFIMFRDKWKIGKIIPYILVGLLIWVAGYVPFAGGKPLFPFILERVLVTVNQYPYTSVNAFNFWAVVGMWKKDNLGVVSPQVLGSLASVGIVSFTVGKLLRKKSDLSEYKLLAVVFLSTFLFLTRMHERHMLPALVPLAILTSDIGILLPYFGLSLTYIANLRYAFVWITDEFKSIFSSSAISIISLLNIVFLALVIFGVPEKIWGFTKRIKLGKEKEVSYPEVKFTKVNTKWLLVLVLVFAFVGRSVFLENPENEYFDEVYHAFTARTMLHGDPKAWEWWNTPPEGFAYEWTHPPLAKLFMWAGMFVLGESSIGWRVPSSILGLGTTYLVYLIANKLLKDKLAAVISAAVFSLDGLPLVMSRIGMNDMYFLFFALLSFYCFVRKWNFFSAMALGLAASSKWTAMYLLPILFISHFVFKRKITPSYLWFLVLPPLVYLASYIPMFATGHSWANFIEVQKQMWWYHTNLKATHAYTSPAYSWPFLIRSVWLYTSGVVEGKVANIYAFGNPAVFWFGLVSVVTTFIYALEAKAKKLGLIVLSYLAFFAPWIVSPRIMFLYHYLPSIPFMAIAGGFTLRKYPKYILPVLFVFLVFFVYFFPHWTGIKVPVWLDNSYYWFDSWK